MRKYYVPFAKRSKQDAKKRRDNVLKRVQKHREKRESIRNKKMFDRGNQNNRGGTDVGEDENQVSSTVSDTTTTTYGSDAIYFQ